MSSRAPLDGRWRRPNLGRAHLVALICLAVGALLTAACGTAARASFDPSGPCTTDGRVARAYPDLEALVPGTLSGRPPASLDSGRNCSTANLGTLAGHGVKEVRFAGAVWTDGPQSGVTLAVFQAPGLEADWMGEWYEASAGAGRVTGRIRVTRITVGGRPASRMDLVNGDSTQVVIAWSAGPGTPSAAGNVVNVVIAADEREARIQEAISAFP